MKRKSLDIENREIPECNDLQGHHIGFLSNTHFHLCALVLFLLSLGINVYHMTYVSSPLDHVYSDMGGYISRAWRIAVGAPFYPFDSFYPPGTSYLFSIVFMVLGFAGGIKTIAFLQAFAVAASNVLLGYTAKELFGHRGVSCTLMLLSCLYWPFTSQVSFFMAEPIFSLLILLGLFLFCRSITRSTSLLASLTLGLLFGISIIIKAQGACVLLPILFLPFLFKQTHHLRRYTPSLLLGVLLPIVMVFAINRELSGSKGLFLSANASFNTYLGQSRLQAIGCLDRNAGVYYSFHNNNAGLKYPFLPPRVLGVSILNRDYFHKQTLALWKDDPWTQTIRSLHNVVELFEINPRWPMRNNTHLISYDVLSQWLFLFIVVVPAFYALYGALFLAEYRLQIALLSIPLLGISAVVFISMGQPRYLLPFSYFFLLLAVPMYIDLSGAITRSLAKGDTSSRSPKPPIGEASLSDLTAFQNKCSSKSKQDRIFTACAWTVLFLLLAASAFGFISLFSRSKNPPPFKSVQEIPGSYEQLQPAQKDALFWAEVGKNGQPLSWLEGEPESALILEGFSPAKHWHQSISPNDAEELNWHAIAGHQGRIRLSLPDSIRLQQQPLVLALYLSDDARNLRNILIRTDDKRIVADALYPGKWVFVSISEKQIEKQRIELNLQKLSGNNVSLSAIALFPKGKLSTVPDRSFQ